MQSRATITSENNSSFPTNNNREITAEFLRNFQEIINSSKFNLTDDSIEAIKSYISNIAPEGNGFIGQFENVMRYVIPAFYVDFEVQVDGDIINFTSNNPTVMLDSTDGPEIVITYEDQFVKWGGNRIFGLYHANLDGNTRGSVVANTVNQTTASLRTPGTNGSGQNSPLGVYRINFYVINDLYFYDL